ncbi:hypothetical protein Chor_014468 [Crotalus horridus]
MSPPGLLVFIVFLFQMRLSGMWPTELVCDRRLIQKYVAEAVEMEESLSQCEELPLLLEPVHLPLVGLNLRVWKTKTEQSTTTLPENVPKLISTRNLRTVFWTYVQLLQGKLNFLFYDLRKDSCAEGHQPGIAFPP